MRVFYNSIMTFMNSFRFSVQAATAARIGKVLETASSGKISAVGRSISQPASALRCCGWPTVTRPTRSSTGQAEREAFGFSVSSCLDAPFWARVLLRKCTLQRLQDSLLSRSGMRLVLCSR